MNMEFPKATADKDLVGLTLTQAINKGYEGQKLFAFGRDIFCTVYFRSPGALLECLSYIHDKLRSKNGMWDHVKIGHDWRDITLEWKPDGTEYLIPWDRDKQMWPAGTWKDKKAPEVDLLGLEKVVQGFMGSGVSFHMAPYVSHGISQYNDDTDYLLDGIFFDLDPVTMLIKSVGYCDPGG